MGAQNLSPDQRTLCLDLLAVAAQSHKSASASENELRALRCRVAEAQIRNDVSEFRWLLMNLEREAAVSDIAELLQLKVYWSQVANVPDTMLLVWIGTVLDRGLLLLKSESSSASLLSSRRDMILPVEEHFNIDSALGDSNQVEMNRNSQRPR